MFIKVFLRRVKINWFWRAIIIGSKKPLVSYILSLYHVHTRSRTLDATVSQVAIAWLLAQPAVSSVVIGARTVEQLDENVASASLTLSKEEVQSLEEGPYFIQWLSES